VTDILAYPMNAPANDQEQPIDQYLEHHISQSWLLALKS